jgi:hypothetical protein
MAKNDSKEQRIRETKRNETKAGQGNPKLAGPDRPST